MRDPAFELELLLLALKALGKMLAQPRGMGGVEHPEQRFHIAAQRAILEMKQLMQPRREIGRAGDKIPV